MGAIIKKTSDITDLICPKGDRSVVESLALSSGVPAQTIYNYRKNKTNPLGPIIKIIECSGYDLVLVRKNANNKT